ncbi:NAD(P)-dependent oxidoreductase [Sphingomonas sp. MMS24-JH45]
MIGDRLAAFGVEVTGVTLFRARLHADPRCVARAARRIRLDRPRRTLDGRYEGTDRRGRACVDEARRVARQHRARRHDRRSAAVIAGLESGRLGGAFLDPTDPEPLPADHPLWSAPRCIVTTHCPAQPNNGKMFQRAGALFLAHLAAYREGRELENVADLAAGY